MTKPKAKQQVKSDWFDKFLSHPYQVIFLVCFLLYARILTFGLVHFDDHGFVLMAADNLKLANIPQFFRHSVFWVLGDTTQDTDVFYRPLQNVLYAICNTISPKQPWSYHFAGLTFHVLASCLVFSFFKQLKYHASVALLFALIYSVHPVLAQGVAWIAGIGDQMATVFCLLSMICFMRMAAEDSDKSNKNLFFHLLFLLCALFSKEVSVVVVPLCMFMIVVHPVSGSGSRIPPFRAGVVAAGWAMLVAVYFIFRNAAIHSAPGSLLSSTYESFKVNGPLVFEYFEKIFLPYRLSPIPSREDAQLLIGLVIFITLISFLIYKKRFTRVTLFGVLWFILFLFPTFIQQNPQAHFFAFEHRLYLPLIGILIVLIELLNVQRINIQSPSQKYGFALVLLLFFGITFSHSRTFNEPYHFYHTAIAASPKSVIAYNGYGKLLLEDEKYAEAIEAFKKSYEYKPDDLQTTGKIADIYLKNLNNPQEAIVWFKKTMDIAPNSIEAAVSMGDAYWGFIHDTSNAIVSYKNALKIDPQNEFALADLGMIYGGMGKNFEARKFLSQALNVNPKSLLALKWMAISYFNEARPDDQVGRAKISESVEYLSRAYENYPDDIDVQRNLMICYYKSNDFVNTGKFASLYASRGNQIPAEIDAYLKSHTP